MSHASCVLFGARSLVGEGLTSGGLRVIDVGSYDPNGGFRALVELHGGFSEYVGVDIREGPGIDIVCDAERIVERFGKGAFDVVIAVELLEHVREWRKAISNLKNVCKPGGIIIITTRSKGFRYHAAPYDFWRYDAEDMREIFSDCELLALEEDTEEPGVFVKARRPIVFEENDLSNYRLYSMITNRRERDVDIEGLRKVIFLFVILRAKFRQLGGLLFSQSKKDFVSAARLQANEMANLLAMLRGRKNSPRI